MSNTFNQTNHSGAIGTQGQVGDNHLHVNQMSDVLQPLTTELVSAAENTTWPDETPAEIKEEFNTPADMVNVAVSEAKLELDVGVAKETQLDSPDSPPVDNEQRESVWTQRFKALLPVGIKVASSAAMAVLSSYSPASPVLCAILKTLTEEVKNND